MLPFSRAHCTQSRQAILAVGLGIEAGGDRARLRGGGTVPRVRAYYSCRAKYLDKPGSNVMTIDGARGGAGMQWFKRTSRGPLARAALGCSERDHSK